MAEIEITDKNLEQARADGSTIKAAEPARSGVISGRVITVLAVSTLLAAVALTGVVVYFA